MNFIVILSMCKYSWNDDEKEMDVVLLKLPVVILDAITEMLKL
jgi:hypothetical protein